MHASYTLTITANPISAISALHRRRNRKFKGMVGKVKERSYTQQHQGLWGLQAPGDTNWAKLAPQ